MAKPLGLFARLKTTMEISIKHSPILILVAMLGIALSAPSQGLAFIFGPSEQERSSEVQYATTPDGWKIALEHVPPSWGNTGKPPVILTHGLGYNGDFWMLSRQVNLAQFLADDGYDVWILSLRGAGKSTKWVYKLAEVGMEAPGIISGVDNKDYATVALKGLSALLKLSQAKMVNASANPKYINWSFDDYVNFDVPTAIEHVKRATGAPQVFWVGHSMGGNVMLAHLATNQRNDLRGVVTVGSQLTMVNGHVVAQYINTLEWVRLTQIRGDVKAEEARMIAKEQARALLFNQNNMEGDLVGRLESAGTDWPAVGVLGQYGELVGAGQFKTADNRFNYAQNAHNINVPLLISAGAEDGFVNASDLAFLHKNVQSQDVTAVIWGSQVGMYPFGHNDALISRRAAAQVYPVILQWLNDRAVGVVASPNRQRHGQTTYQQPPVRDKHSSQTPMKALPALDY
jgi:pimeloyl-ACP methyl ester carboxylesterase